MTRRYDSFVIRCWRLDDQVLQVVVEHVQSGEQARGTTLDAAFDWLSLQAGLKLEQSGPLPPVSVLDSESASPDIGAHVDEQDYSP